MQNELATECILVRNLKLSFGIRNSSLQISLKILADV